MAHLNLPRSSQAYNPPSTGGSRFHIAGYDEVRRDINGLPIAEEFRDRDLMIKGT